MSWEDYKKLREANNHNTSRIVTFEKNNIGKTSTFNATTAQTSSWEKYKKKRQQEELEEKVRLEQEQKRQQLNQRLQEIEKEKAQQQVQQQNTQNQQRKQEEHVQKTITQQQQNKYNETARKIITGNQMGPTKSNIPVSSKQQELERLKSTNLVNDVSKKLQTKEQFEESQKKAEEQRQQNIVKDFIAQTPELKGKTAEEQKNEINNNKEIRNKYLDFKEEADRKEKKKHQTGLEKFGDDVWNLVENTGAGFGKGFVNIGRSLVRGFKNDFGDGSPIYSLGATATDIVDKSGNTGTEIKKTGKKVEPKADIAIENLGKKKENINKYIEKNIEDTNYTPTKKAAELLPSIGQMLPSMAVSSVYPITGGLLATETAADDYYDDAISRGMNEQEANTYATIMGTIEGLTENLQLGKAVNVGKKIAGKEVAKEASKNTIKSALKDFGLDIADNAIQEAITEPISEAIATFVGGDEVADWDNMGNRMLKSGFDGALSAVITNGASASVGSAVRLKNKIQNGEKITQQELKTTIEDIKKSGINVEEIALNEINSQVEKLNNANLQKSNANEINQKQEEINNIDSQIKKQEATNNSEDFRGQQLVEQLLDEMYKEKSIKQAELTELLSQEQEKQNKYQYISSDNENIDELRKSASKYLDNSIKSQDLVDTIEKVIDDKDYSVIFDNTITNENGQKVNAQVKTLDNGKTEIRINPESNRAAEILLTHEITHSIETTEMKNLVMDYANKNEDFAGALQELKEQYGDEDVSDEVLADVSGQLFGNQEFINDLSMQKPSTFKRIYNAIISLANKLTGNKIESLFIKDLKNKWQQAYSNINKNIDGTKYHISKNFENEIDKALNNELPSNSQVKARDYTPEILVKNGVRDLPMLITKKHIMSTIYTQQEAQHLNLPIKNINYHGLGKDALIKAIDNLDNPKAIYKSNENNYIIVTELQDNNGKDIIVPIQINGKGVYNDVFIDENHIKSAYGKNNLDNYLNKNNFEVIYKKEDSDFNEGIQYSNIADSSDGLGLKMPVPSINNIQQNTEDIKRNITEDNRKRDEGQLAKVNNDTRYSQNSDTPLWQQWLEENFQSKGTRTKFEDILAPVQQKVQEEVKNTVQDIIAPIKENIQTMSVQIESLVDEIAPVININDNTNSTKSANNTTKESALDYIQSTFEISKEEAENLYNKIINTKNYNVKEVYEILQDLQKQEDVTIWNNEDLENISKNIFNNVAKSQEDIKENNYNDFLDNIGYTESLEKKEEPYNYYDFINNNEIKFNEKEKNIIQDLEEKLDINNKQAKNIYDKLAKKKFLIKADVYDLLNQYKSLGEEDITTQEVKTLINNTQFDISNVNDFYKKLSTKYPFIFDNNIIQPKQQMEEITKFQNEDSRADFYQYDDTQIRAYSEQLFNKISTIKEEKQKEDVMNFIAGLDYKDDVMNSYNKESSSTKNNKQSTLDYIVEKRTKDQVSLKEIKDTVAQRIINQGHYVDKLSERTKNPQLKYSYDRYLGSLSEAQYSIGEKQTDNKGNVVGKSITEIFRPAIKGGKYKEFNDYLLNRHNIDRMAMDKSVYGNEFTANDSKDIVFNYEKQYPEFKEWAKDVYKYNKNALKNKMEAGFISKDTYENFLAMYGSYVPTFRDIVEPNLEKVDSPQAGFSPINKATGGNSDILVIDEAMAEQVVAEKRALRLNETLKQLYHSLGEESRIVNNMPIDDPIATSLLMSDTNNFINIGENGEVTALFFEDGEITQFQINNDLYKAFDNKNTWNGKIQNNKVANKLLKPLEKITSFRRDLLTTYSIGFSLNNPIKDIQEAVFNTKYSTPRFALNYGRALFEIATGGDYYKSYMANGGGANTYFEYGTGLKKEQSIPMKVISAPFKAINTLNEIIERAPRLAEYISTMQKTGDVNEAMYNASELTTNFKRGGDITKAFNKYGVNFLNASVQGLDKMYRNLTGQNGWKGYASLITRATIFAIAPSLINYLIYQDDDDYEDLPEYVTNKYWLFKTNDNKFIRIPQGRVTSILGDAATSILKVAQGKGDLKTEFFGFLDNAMEQSAPNNPISNNILSPYFQAKSNTSWYGGDIVPTRLQDVPEAEQYDEKTDEFSKWLGNQINYSPKKINYLLDQYGGGIADVLLPMSTPYAENNIIEDKFTIDAIMKNKHVGEFYDLLEEMEKQKNSKRATEDDNLTYKYLYSQNSAMSDYYKQKREIESSDELTDKEKKEQVREVQKNINNIAEQAIEEYQNLNKKSNYATIGGQEYKKNTKGEWETITEKKQEKVDGLKLSDTQKDKYYTIQNKISNINKKYSDDNKNVAAKRQEITNTIKNTNLSDNAKVQLYKSSYSTDTKIDKAIDCGISADKYLTYASETFTADKDKNGKSISGSKKTKVISYVNSLDLSAGQKAVLLKMEGYNDYNKQAIQYINGLKISASKKQSIYKDLGFKVNSNGTISW